MRQRGSSVIRVKVKATTGRAELIGFTEWVTHHRRGDNKTYWENQGERNFNTSQPECWCQGCVEGQPIRGWQGGAPASWIFFPSVYYNCDQFANLDFASSEPFRALLHRINVTVLWIVRLSGTLMWHPASRNFFASVEGGHDIQWEACPTHQRLSANQRLTREKNSYRTVHPAFQKLLEGYKME